MKTTVNTIETQNTVNNAVSFVPGTRLTRAEIAEHTADDDAPALYVGTYGKYNGGSLRGMWIALDSFDDVDDFYNFIAALHADEDDPEYMAQDFQNFPRRLYSESLDRDNVAKIIELFNEFDEDDRAKIFEYWDEVDGSADPSDILDRCVWSGEFEDFADEMADELILCESGSETLKRYFDYKAWARDLAFDYTVTSNFVFQY